MIRDKVTETFEKYGPQIRQAVNELNQYTQEVERIRFTDERIENITYLKLIMLERRVRELTGDTNIGLMRTSKGYGSLLKSKEGEIIRRSLLGV